MADARKDKVRLDSEVFQRLFGDSGPEGSAPEEEGLDDSIDQAVPSQGEELAKNGWKSGEVPFGPSAVEGSASTKVGEIIKKLRQEGFPETKLAKAAEDIRLYGTHRFLDPAGKVRLEVGVSSPLGQELRAYGKEAAAAREAQAGGYRYLTGANKLKMDGP